MSRRGLPRNPRAPRSKPKLDFSDCQPRLSLFLVASRDSCYGVTGSPLRVHRPYHCLQDGSRIWIYWLRLFCLLHHFSSSASLLPPLLPANHFLRPPPPQQERRLLQTSCSLALKRMATRGGYTEIKTAFETRISMWTRSSPCKAW